MLSSMSAAAASGAVTKWFLGNISETIRANNIGLIAIFSLYFYALHKRLVSCCIRGHLAHAGLFMVMHECFQNNWQQVL